MDTNQIVTMKKTFDDYKKYSANGVEYWNAHELARAMGYSEFAHFKPAINRAIQQMITTGKNPSNHIVECAETFVSGRGGKREVPGYMMDRYGAYLVAMNADPSKIEVAFAQEYFLQATAQIEALQQRLYAREYMCNRNYLKVANASLSSTLNNFVGVRDHQVGIVMDTTDQGMFDKHTKELKEEFNVPQNKPVADIFGPKMSAYKAVAQFNTEQELINQNAHSLDEACRIGFDENRAIRNMIQEKYHKNPEDLITGEDIKKVTRTYNKQLGVLKQKLENNFDSTSLNE